MSLFIFCLLLILKLILFYNRVVYYYTKIFLILLPHYTYRCIHIYAGCFATVETKQMPQLTLFSFSFFRLQLIKKVKIFIYSTKYSKIIFCSKKNVFNVKIYSQLFKQDTFSNRSQIFKFDKNFDAHDTCEDLKAIGAILSGPRITHNKCACFIKNFADRIQLNGGHLDLVLKGTF